MTKRVTGTQDNFIDELHELRAENARLRARLAARGIRVDVKPDDYPSPSEWRQLRAIVCNAYFPQLKGDDDAAIESAFLWMVYQRRADTPDQRYQISYWIDMCTAWMREQALNGDVRVPHLMAACVMHGDIPFVLTDTGAGTVAALGLKVGAGTPYRSAWRTILAQGRAPAPVAVKYPTQRPGRLRVEGGGDVAAANRRHESW